MNYKLFILLIIFGTLISWLSLVLVVTNLDPFQTGFGGFLVFYLSFFLALTGSFYLAGTLWAGKFSSKPMGLNRIKSSLRHALLFTFLIVIWALMKSQLLLRWWNLLLLLAILTILEFFFISYERETKITSYEGENQTT